MLGGRLRESLSAACRSMQKEMDAWLDYYDTNKDGKVHKDEYFGQPKSNQRYWDSVDINNDECVPLLLAQPRALS